MGARTRAALLVVLLTLAVCPGAARGQDAANNPSLQAAPAAAAVDVDGRLDEAVWSEAEALSDFTQFQPEEGGEPTLETEVRVLYGENSLFIGARMHDPDPSAIEATLARRDDINRADWFFVSIDSYFDRRTAYMFGINAAGVQFDALRSGANDFDTSWDAVWYSDVHITSDGWVAEARIPYSMLRFSDEDEQTWGIFFARIIPRLGEENQWPYIPRTERDNMIAQFGLLEGISGVEPRRNVQLRPYVVTDVHTYEHPETPGRMLGDGNVDAGGDVKIGLGPNVTLDATINPDFGQVESDPAVLNLSAFETFFQERRPFFIEGIQIFEFSAGPGQLLYTRRIGAAAPILGAAKLSGRTAEGLSFGLLAATTSDDFDSYRHYGVGRATQQIGTYSSAGGILTGSYRAESQRRSLVGGADWDIRFLDNGYGAEGFLSLTHRSAPDFEQQTGFAGKIWLRRRRGAVRGFVGFDLFSDEFNPNDLGLLQQNNFFAVLNSLEYDINGGRAFGPFQRAGLQYFAIQQFAYQDRLNLGLSLNFGSRWTLKSFQEIQLGGSVQKPFGGYDLYETRGLGPWAEPFTLSLEAEFGTDDRKSWQLEPEAGFTVDANGGRSFNTGLELQWNVGSRLALAGGFDGEWEDGVTAWSSNEVFLRSSEGWMIGSRPGPPDRLLPDEYVPIPDPADLDLILNPVVPDAEGRYYVPVFGERDTRSIDLTVRGTITFIPDLSLQLYSQLFLARGRYENFQIMQTRDDLAPFEGYPKRDNFAFSSLQSNVVLRWEYRPGSALYVVWTHGRRADAELNPLGPWGPPPYDRGIGDQIGETFGVFPNNVFLVKVDYTFLY